MTSEFTLKVLEEIRRTNQIAETLESAIAPVRECLEGLSRRQIQGELCWCVSRALASGQWMAPEAHEVECQRTRVLYFQLQLKE